MKNKNLLVAILVIGVGVGGFFAGMKYQENRQFPKLGFRAMKGRRQRGMPGLQEVEGSGMIRVKGEIIGQDKESVTIKLPDDSSKIVLVSEKTMINKMTEGVVGDLETGKQIVVFGQENSDKSISATNIQLDFGFKEGMRGN